MKKLSSSCWSLCFLLFWAGLAFCSKDIIALEIRDPGVIKIGEGKEVVACAVCHKEPAKELWHPGIEYEARLPVGQHTKAVEAGMIRIWQSHTTTANGIEKTGELLNKYELSSHTREDKLREKLADCQAQFEQLQNRPMSTVNQVVEESARIALAVQKIYLRLEMLRDQQTARTILALVILGVFLLSMAIIKGQLAMYRIDDNEAA